MLKQLFEYATVERDKGIRDFTEIISGFYARVNFAHDDNSQGNSFTKRFTKMMKEYVETDPKYQSRLDEYAKVSS